MEYSVNCPCGRENVTEEKCPVCGTDLTSLRKIQELEYKQKSKQEKGKKKNRLIAILAVLLNLIIITGIALYFTKGSSDESEASLEQNVIPTETSEQITPVPTLEPVDIESQAVLIREAIEDADIPYEISVEPGEDSVELKGTVPDKWIKDVVVLIAQESAEGAKILTDNLIVDESINVTEEDAYINYTVVDGDTLGAIALKIYGDYDMWETIYENNKDTIKDPAMIYKGEVLKIYLEDEG